MSDTDEKLGRSVSLEDLKVGDWIRIYTTGMRLPSECSTLYQIEAFKYCRPNKRRGITRHRIGLTARNAMTGLKYEGESIRILELNPPITEGVKLL